MKRENVNKTLEEYIVLEKLQKDEEYCKEVLEYYKNNKNVLSVAEIRAVDKLEALKERKINSYYFLKYLERQGLSKESSTNILEVCPDKRSGLNSFLLNQGYKTTVLSNDTNTYLDNSNTENYIYGKLTMEGIEPETQAVDVNNFSSLIFSGKIDSAEIPSIYDFDTIICEGYCAIAPIVMSYPTKNYLGFCAEKDSEEASKLARYYQKVVERLNIIYKQEFYLYGSHDPEINKVFALIKIR